MNFHWLTNLQWLKKLFDEAKGLRAAAGADFARRGRGTPKRKDRTPFASQRQRALGVQRMTIEEFTDKAKRNDRFQQLRAQGTPHVSKFSTVRDNRSVWCVVRP